MSRKKARKTGAEAWQAAFEATDHAPLLAALGVEIEPELLKLALTHRSFAHENGNLPNNERLEFVGDAVLGLSVGDELYVCYPDRPESHISKMRAGIVSRYGLAEVARRIELGPHILLGKGERLSDGADKDSILADTTEALFGAIYRQHGFAVARSVIVSLTREMIDSAVESNRTRDFKTSLQELVASLKAPAAEYTATRSGPDHNPEFISTVSVNNVTLATGVGPNRRKAEQIAAGKALAALEENPDLISVGE